MAIGPHSGVLLSKTDVDLYVKSEKRDEFQYSHFSHLYAVFGVSCFLWYFQNKMVLEI